MNHTYFIKITSLTSYSYENILKIIQNGSDIGCVYLDFMIDRSENFELSLSDAAEKIMLQEQDGNNQADVLAKYKDTWIKLNVSSSEGLLNCGITAYSNIWKKAFLIDGYETNFVNLDLYIRLALNFCKNLPIEELSTWKI